MRLGHLRIKFSTTTECSLTVLIIFLIFWVPVQRTDVQGGRDIKNYEHLDYFQNYSIVLSFNKMHQPRTEMDQN
jgi:hypothetical protein